MTGTADPDRRRGEELVARLARELVERGQDAASREREQQREIRRLRADLTEARDAERQARERARRHQARLEEVRRSTTWRVGAAVLWLPSLVRTLVRGRGGRT